MNFRVLISILFMTTSFQGFSQFQLMRLMNPDDVRIAAEPVSVRVYLSGVQINAAAKTTLKKGRQTIVFENVSNYAEENSIQVRADKDITILSVNYQLNYLQAPGETDSKSMNDSLEIYNK